MRRRRNPEIISGRVNADGTILAGDGFSVQKGTVGNYTLIFAPGFRVLTVTGNTIAAVTTLYPTAYPGGNTASIGIINNASAGVDVGFAFVATGVQQ